MTLKTSDSESGLVYAIASERCYIANAEGMVHSIAAWWRIVWRPRCLRMASVPLPAVARIQALYNANVLRMIF